MKRLLLPDIVYLRLNYENAGHPKWRCIDVCSCPSIWSQFPANTNK
jgi:hypothetical protein